MKKEIIAVIFIFDAYTTVSNEVEQACKDEQYWILNDCDNYGSDIETNLRPDREILYPVKNCEVHKELAKE